MVSVVPWEPIGSIAFFVGKLSELVYVQGCVGGRLNPVMLLKGIWWVMGSNIGLEIIRCFSWCYFFSAAHCRSLAYKLWKYLCIRRLKFLFHCFCIIYDSRIRQYYVVFVAIFSEWLYYVWNVLAVTWTHFVSFSLPVVLLLLVTPQRLHLNPRMSRFFVFNLQSNFYLLIQSPEIRSI